MHSHSCSGLLKAAPFAGLFLILAVTVSQMPAGSKGFRLDIAVPSRQGQLCGDGDRLFPLRVPANGGSELNREALELARLPGRLREVFKDRVETIVFILADKDAAFGQVPAVIEMAGPQVGRLALLSLAVQGHPGDCGPTLPAPQASRQPAQT